METVFAWKTLECSYFKTEVIFEFGNPLSIGNLSSWNSVYEDLEITIKIEVANKLPANSTFILPDEQLGIVLRWQGDKKFSGCSRIYDIDFDKLTIINYIVPKASCSTNIWAECNLIVKHPQINDSQEWVRPPGSIISIIPVIENSSIGRGSLFPVMEYEGDGKSLIKWDFSNTDDLEISPFSSFNVLVDKKHPFFGSNSKNSFNESLIMLMIIQGFVRKAFSENIYQQLNEKEMEGEAWKSHSVGYAFSTLLKKICTYLRINTLQTLNTIYLTNPEKIDQSIDNIFTEVLKQRKITNEYTVIQD